jgi:MFS family permease
MADFDRPAPLADRKSTGVAAPDTPAAVTDLPRRAEDLSTCQRWLIFAALMVPYMFYAFCWNTEDFLRPYAAESLKLSRVQVATFYSLQALGSLIGAIVLSQWADRRGRRRALAATTAGFGVAAIGALLVYDYRTALLQRFVMGFFLGGVYGCVVSLYVGLFSPTSRGFLSGIVILVFNGGDALLAWLGRLYGPADWREVLVVGGCGALAAALVVLLLVPRDGALIPWNTRAPTPGAAPGRTSVTGLFVHRRWRLTVRLALLCGLNFFAYQAFNGWATTYLREVHHLSPDQVGRLMAMLFVGSMAGALPWGLVADRFGRRANALGFALAAVFIVAYMRMPPTPFFFGTVGFAYGFCLVTSGIWGPYFAELYPAELRATAASIFQWGRIVSLFGAVVAGAIAERFGLATTMYVGSATFVVATAIWWSLPETLGKAALTP